MQSIRKTLHLLFVIFLSINGAFAQENNCSRLTNFGAAEICLPMIDGYQECYQDSVVKYIADATEVEMNMVLGYYLNNKIHLKRDSLGLISFEDYFKIYGTKQIKDLDADSEILKEMEDVLAANFLSKNWETMKDEIIDMDLGIEVGAPVVINSYNLDPNSFTMVMLVNYQAEAGETYAVAMTVNGMILHERLVWMAYYLNYKSEATIVKLEQNSNNILTLLLNANR